LEVFPLLFAAYRSSGVASDLGSLKAAQKQTNVGISKIQENQSHQPPVTVNMPPAPKQRAIVALSKDTADDGIKIIRAPQESGMRSIRWKNSGERRHPDQTDAPRKLGRTF
jgi:hypothetical protein